MGFELRLDLVIKNEVCGQIVENIASPLATKYMLEGSDIRHSFGCYPILAESINLWRDRLGIEPDPESADHYAMFVSKGFLEDVCIYTGESFLEDRLVQDSTPDLTKEDLEQLKADTDRLLDLISEIDWATHCVVLSYL